MFSTTSSRSRGAALTLPPTDGIADRHARAFCDAMRSAWNVRNGGTGPGDANTFITRAEAGAAATEAVVRLLSGAASPEAISGAGTTTPEHQAVLDAVVGIVTSSKLYQLLRTPIQQIPIPRARVNALLDDVEAINTQIDEILLELGDVGAAIIAEQEARVEGDEATATVLNAAVARIDDAEAAILAEATARSDGDTANASNILALTARVADGDVAPFSPAVAWNFNNSTESWSTLSGAGTVAAYNDISILATSPATGATLSIIRALAASEQVYGRRADKVRMRLRRVSGTAGWFGRMYYTTGSHGSSASYYKQIAEPVWGVGGWATVEWDMANLTVGASDWINNDIIGLRFDLLTDAVSNSLEIDWIAVGTRSFGLSRADFVSEQTVRASADDAMADDIDLLFTAVGDAESGILTEQSTRSNKDNALAAAVNTLWANIGGAAALIQDSALAAVSPVAVTATKWEQVQAAVTDPVTGEVNAASIKAELTAYANAVDGTLNTTWSIRSNINGHITGIGLMTEAGAGSDPDAATSHFMVMADRFSLVNPSDTSLTPVPFSVDSSGNAVFAGRMSASGLYGGEIRGINVNAGSFTTKGSYTTAEIPSGAAAVYLQNTADFSSGGGTAYIFDTSNDRDTFTYTGKTATSLTGVSGVLSHIGVGKTVVPWNQPGMVIDALTNEMRYFGNRGDGVIDELATIGRQQVGGDYTIARFGNASSSNLGLSVQSSATAASFTSSSSGGATSTVIVSNSGGGRAMTLFGPSSLSTLNVSSSAAGDAISAAATGSGNGGYFQGNATRAPLRLGSSIDAWPSNRLRGQITFMWRYYPGDEFTSPYSLYQPAYTNDLGQWCWFSDNLAAA